MGLHYKLHCKKCNYKIEITQGTGMLEAPFINESNKIFEEIKFGKHGGVLEEAIKKDPTSLVIISHEPFVCKNCKTIKQDLDITLLTAKKPYIISKTHYCTLCGETMTIHKDPKNLKCPHCRIKLSTDVIFAFD